MYQVTCPSCGGKYDAATAADCNCLEAVRSFQCPHCSSCFCSSKKDFKDRFWNNAPAEVWDRRRKRTAGNAADPAQAEVTRPMVLFADDDSVGRAIARQTIRNLGFGVVVAANGEEALDLARTHKPELVITDALMPKLDGRELAKTIKSEQPDAKVVVITGVYKDPRYKHEAQSKFAVDEYLPKPVKPEALTELVKKYLG
jgi:CheY-like chemotaxis protein